MTSPFDRFSADDLSALIAQYPLAWIVPQGGPPLAAALLPLLGEYGPDGALAALAGHMSRRNPLCAALAADPRAAILFTGPQGYVSPEHAGLSDWGPTWNYVQVVVEGEADILPGFTEEAIGRLTEAMEPEGWRSDALGDRYDGMVERIIGFRIRVKGVTARFKLGQDEKPEVLRTILARHPDAALVAWMRWVNGE